MFSAMQSLTLSTLCYYLYNFDVILVQAIYLCTIIMCPFTNIPNLSYSRMIFHGTSNLYQVYSCNSMGSRFSYTHTPNGNPHICTSLIFARNIINTTTNVLTIIPIFVHFVNLLTLCLIYHYTIIDILFVCSYSVKQHAQMGPVLE